MGCLQMQVLPVLNSAMVSSTQFSRLTASLKIGRANSSLDRLSSNALRLCSATAAQLVDECGLQYTSAKCTVCDQNTTLNCNQSHVVASMLPELDKHAHASNGRVDLVPVLQNYLLIQITARTLSGSLLPATGLWQPLPLDCALHLAAVLMLTCVQ